MEVLSLVTDIKDESDYRKGIPLAWHDVIDIESAYLFHLENTPYFDDETNYMIASSYPFPSKIKKLSRNQRRAIERKAKRDLTKQHPTFETEEEKKN